jgi:phage baseplate assembly protein W
MSGAASIPGPRRGDWSVPFRIDAAFGEAAQASYQDHVDQMIRQVLLTDPGERVCLPTFGAGLRRLMFAPLSAQLQASTQMIVTQALSTWLANQITVNSVVVDTPLSNPGLPDGTILITISYVLIETQSVQQTQVQVS